MICRRNGAPGTVPASRIRIHFEPGRRPAFQIHATTFVQPARRSSGQMRIAGCELLNPNPEAEPGVAATPRRRKVQATPSSPVTAAIKPLPKKMRRWRRCHPVATRRRRHLQPATSEFGLKACLKTGGAGGPPTGMATRHFVKRTLPFGSTVVFLPSGVAPDGTGGPPVPPGNDYSETPKSGRADAARVFDGVLVWRAGSRCDPRRLAARGAPPQKSGHYRSGARLNQPGVDLNGKICDSCGNFQLKQSCLNWNESLNV